MSSSSSPRSHGVPFLNGSSAAGFVIRARATWAQQATEVNDSNAGVSSQAARTSAASPLSPGGPRNHESALDRAGSSSPRTSAATTDRPWRADEDDVTTAPVAVSFSNTASSQRKITLPIGVQHSKSQLTTPRVSSTSINPSKLSVNVSQLPPSPRSRMSGASHRPSSLSRSSLQGPPSPLQMVDTMQSVFMGRPAASAVANAALQSASFRLSSPRSTPADYACVAATSNAGNDPVETQARSTVASVHSEGSSPMVSPRGAIAQQSLSRSIRRVTHVMTMPIRFSSTHGTSAEHCAESGTLSVPSLHEDARSREVTTMNEDTENPFSVQTVLRRGLPINYHQASETSQVMIASPPAGALRLSVEADTTMLHQQHGEKSFRLADVHEASSQASPRNHLGSLWAGVGDDVGSRTSDVSRRSTLAPSRPSVSADVHSLRQQAHRREITPASLRRAAGQDEGASTLSKRLAAMDEALRAIGAA